MTEVDKKREATASIRGYIYQLDAALLEILRAGMEDKIVIEGIEDFDRYSDDAVTYSQVKYYAGSNLTDSVLREPLQKLLAHFVGLDAAERTRRKYVLYGHYSEVKISTDQLTVARIKQIMKYSEFAKDADGKRTKTKLEKSYLDELSVSDQVIEAFCHAFSIKVSEEFVEHRASAITAVRKAQNVSVVEAEGFHYPRAFDFIATMATKSDHSERTTTRRALIEHLRGTHAIHHQWFRREKGEASYARYVSNLYFSDRNSAGVVRVFIIEVAASNDSGSIHDLLREIARKWSSAKTATMPNSDRYAPFVFLRNANQNILTEVKTALFDTGTIFVDGYPYRGSPFRNDHLNTAQTRERAIALRIVEDIDQLSEAIANVGHKLSKVYDFFLERPLATVVAGSKTRMFSIPIEDVSTIAKMI